MKNFLVKSRIYNNALIIFFIIFLSFSFNIKAQTIDCILVRESGKYLINEGKNCAQRYSPASTFKVPLALMGYESKILEDENHPIWHPKQKIQTLAQYWDGEKTPFSWMKYSVVWYSQNITTKLGIKKFQQYVNILNYGNKDLSGNKGMNDGLTQSWLSSSLLISPVEQLDFIEKLANNKLPFSLESQDKSKNLIRLMEESLLSDGWNIYGKTGTDIDKINNQKKGYFIGFATKENRLISFVGHISGKKDSNIGGIYTKKIVIDRMENILKDDKKDI